MVNGLFCASDGTKEKAWEELRRTLEGVPFLEEMAPNQLLGICLIRKRLSSKRRFVDDRRRIDDELRIVINHSFIVTPNPNG